MPKVVVFVNGGNVSYIGSNLENLELVLVDGDNLQEMGYSNNEIDQIVSRETTGLKEVNITAPIESNELMVVQSYKPSEPWKPTAGKWCWEEVPGISEFKLTKFQEEREGCAYYEFEGVVPEALQQQEKIVENIIDELAQAGNHETLKGNTWLKIEKQIPGAPDGYEVNTWHDGHELKMTAYPMVEGADGVKRASMLEPILTHKFSPGEIHTIQKGIDAHKSSLIQQMAQGASSGKGLLDALSKLEKTKQNPDPKV